MHRMASERAPTFLTHSLHWLASLLCTFALTVGQAETAHADESPARRAPSFEFLPLGSQCRGMLPCDRSGDFGIHARLFGALALDEQYRVREGLLAPSVIISALKAGECGVAFPLRFYDSALPIPERLRVFCQASLPKSLLPQSGGAVFASVNLAVGPFTEADAPAGARSTTADIGATLSGDMGSLVHAGVAVWATLGEEHPQLHAGPELSLRTDYVTLFAQAQFHGRISCPLSSPGCTWGLLSTFGASFPLEAVPTSAHVSFGRGAAAPTMIVAVQGGLTYDVKVRARYGDGHAAAERFWDRLVAPYRYRLRLRSRGYYDPYPDDNGLLRDDLDHSILGVVGIPDPMRPGYILTPSGISIPVGASLEVRGDRPLLASPAFPGRVISYIPLDALAGAGRASTRPLLDETYFTWLEEERRREELAIQDDLRRMDSPWAKAALNAVAGLLTDPLLGFLAIASPDTADFRTLRRQARLAPYRDGYEEYKGEIAEDILAVYGSVLTQVAGAPLRVLSATAARELTLAFSSVRAQASQRSSRLLARLAPRLNPSNYRIELQGLGSNFGNIKVGYAGTESGLATVATGSAERSPGLQNAAIGSPSEAASYGENATSKLRSHWGDIQRLAKEHGVPMPGKFKEAGPQISSFIDDVIRLGETRVGPYKPTGGGWPNALWTKHGNTIVIRSPEGRFVTILDAAGGGAAVNYPGGL